MASKKHILIIQTAFIGDVILATGLIESIAATYPNTQIDFLLRKGNEGLLLEHPKLNNVHIWDKTQGKYKNLFVTLKKIRAIKYDVLINLQRFASSGLLTAFSKAKITIGFKKNPLAWAFTKSFPHEIDGTHEIERNHKLIAWMEEDMTIGIPKLYPTEIQQKEVKNYQVEPYVCMAPSSVWFTKALPKEKWIELLNKTSGKVYLIGAPSDRSYCDELIRESKKQHAENLCGQLSLLQSAALMEKAEMNYVNDSAPLHLCTAMAAPVTAFFCSTVPTFGFGPYLSNGKVLETKEELSCRPCGLHGKKRCPEGHFKCGHGIEI